MKVKTKSATKILKKYIDNDPELKAMVTKVKAKNLQITAVRKG